MENDRYLYWTGIWVGGSIGMYYVAGVRGLSWKNPIWWGGLATGYFIAYLQGPREYKKSPEYIQFREELETNYGAL